METGMNIGHLVMEGNPCFTLPLELFDVRLVEVHGRILPYLELLLQLCSHVIVCGSPPEIGFQRSALAQQ